MYYMYLRKSRKDEELGNASEEETLARHERTLLDLAHRMGITIDKIYREVVSGETIAARPKMQELLLDIENGLCDGVFVMEVERLARGNTRDQGLVSEAFQYSDTKIITPMRIYDPCNEADQEYFEFGLFMSRREYQAIARRISAGRKAAVKEGKYAANVSPYGYARKKLDQEKGWILVADPDEAPVVKMIFDLYVNGEIQSDGSIAQLGTTSIAKKLNELCIPTRTGVTWTTPTIRDILQNPVYIGKLRWGRRRNQKKMVNGIIEVKRPKAFDYLLADGRHESLIDLETFDKASDKFKIKGRPISNKQMMNPLAGLVICAKCGHVMQRRPYDKRRMPTLICSYNDCDNIGSDLINVETAILQALKDWMESYELDTESFIQESGGQKIAMLESNIGKQKKNIEDLQKQLNNVYDLLEQGIYDTDTFISRSKILKDQIGTLNQSLLIQEQELDKEMKISKSRETIIPKIKNLLETYDHMETAKEKNDALCAVLEKVLYNKSTRRKKYEEGDTFEITIYPKVPHL